MIANNRFVVCSHADYKMVSRIVSLEMSRGTEAMSQRVWPQKSAEQFCALDAGDSANGAVFQIKNIVVQEKNCFTGISEFLIPCI